MARILLFLSFLVLNTTKCSTANKNVEIASGETTVYITKTGTKYHTENCSSLSKSKTSITLEDAVSKGYTPCKLCNPPVLKTAEK